MRPPTLISASRVWILFVAACTGHAAQAAPAAVAPAPNEPALRVLSQFLTPTQAGISGRPFVDSERERLYVPSGNRVDVLDLHTGAPVGQIASLRNARTVIIDAASKRGFVADQGRDRLVVFDPESLATVTTIATGGRGTDAIAVDGETGRVFVTHTTSKDIGIFDARSLKLLARVPVEGTPRQLVANHYGRMFVTVGDRDSVLVIDTRRMRAAGSFPLFGGTRPDGIGIDPINRRLFVATENGRLIVLDSDIGFLLADLPISAGASSVVVDVTAVPGGEIEKPAIIHAYTGSGSGPLTVVRMLRFDTFAVTQSLELEHPTQWLALDGERHRVVAVSAGQAGITVTGR